MASHPTWQGACSWSPANSVISQSPELSCDDSQIKLTCWPSRMGALSSEAITIPSLFICCFWKYSEDHENTGTSCKSLKTNEQHWRTLYHLLFMEGGPCANYFTFITEILITTLYYIIWLLCMEVWCLVLSYMVKSHIDKLVMEPVWKFVWFYIKYRKVLKCLRGLLYVPSYTLVN